jgi:hypothetical protein
VGEALLLARYLLRIVAFAPISRAEAGRCGDHERPQWWQFSSEAQGREGVENAAVHEALVPASSALDELREGHGPALLGEVDEVRQHPLRYRDPPRVTGIRKVLEIKFPEVSGPSLRSFIEPSPEVSRRVLMQFLDERLDSGIH